MNRRQFTTTALASLVMLPQMARALDVPEGAPPALRDRGYLTNVTQAMFNGPKTDVIARLQTPTAQSRQDGVGAGRGAGWTLSG